MSLRKHFSCDLCGTSITDDGVGILHMARGEIRAVWLHKEGAGRHLCNGCVRGLRAMLADLDRLGAIHDELDAAEAACSSNTPASEIASSRSLPDAELGPGRPTNPVKEEPS